MSNLRTFYWLCIIKLCRLLIWLRLAALAGCVSDFTGLRVRLEALIGGCDE